MGAENISNFGRQDLRELRAVAEEGDGTIGRLTETSGAAMDHLDAMGFDAGYTPFALGLSRVA